MKTTKTQSSKVGIALPVYNAERYLAVAIESHLSQSYSDFELVISDNASTDGTRDICERFARLDNRIKYLRHDINRGLSWNHVTAFDACTSPYFRWAAADDIPGDGLVAEMVRILDQDPATALCVPHTINIDEHGNRSDELPRTLELGDSDAYSRIRAVLTRSYQMVFLQGLMRRDVLLTTSRRWNYYGWDFILLAECALRGKVSLTKDTYLLRRLHEGQASRVQREVTKSVNPVEPTFRSVGIFPHWRWQLERLRAVCAAPLSTGEKAKCAKLILRHTWWVRSALWQDLSLAVRNIVPGSRRSPL
jgi:glycosyltransferase involved in cell wall biosynthesis